MNGWLGFWIGLWLFLGIICVGGSFADSLVGIIRDDLQRWRREEQSIAQLMSWQRKLEHRIATLEVTTARRRVKTDANSQPATPASRTSDTQTSEATS
jgi:hypothetical protein